MAVVWTKSRPGSCWTMGLGVVVSPASGVGGAWPLDWVREGGTKDGEGASNPCRNSPSLSFAERSYEAFALATSPACRDQITSVIGRQPNTGVTITKSPTPSTQMHDAIQATPCFCCTKIHHRDYAGRQYGRDGTAAYPAIHAENDVSFSAAPIHVACAGDLPPKRLSKPPADT
jgi:hypothetical protein